MLVPLLVCYPTAIPGGGGPGIMQELLQQLSSRAFLRLSQKAGAQLGLTGFWANTDLKKKSSLVRVQPNSVFFWITK